MTWISWTDAGTYTVNFTAAATGHPATGAYEFQFAPPAKRAGTGGNTGLIGIGIAIVLAAIGAAAASVVVARRRAAAVPTRAKGKSVAARKR